MLSVMESVAKQFLLSAANWQFMKDQFHLFRTPGQVELEYDNAEDRPNEDCRPPSQSILPPNFMATLSIQRQPRLGGRAIPDCVFVS
jgi:hypothetical protein